jgi:hypothetical protein
MQQGIILTFALGRGKLAGEMWNLGTNSAVARGRRKTTKT